MVDERSGDGTRTHAQRLPAEITTLAAANHCALAEIDLFAVATGPGSFTGMRIGIATIQGFAYVHGRRVFAVSALEALAHAASAGLGEAAVIGAWMDAHRRDVFAALYRVTPAAPFSRPRLAAIDGPAVDSPDATLVRWRTLGVAPAVIVGDARGDVCRRYPARRDVDAHRPAAAARRNDRAAGEPRGRRRDRTRGGAPAVRAAPGRGDRPGRTIAARSRRDERQLRRGHGHLGDRTADARATSTTCCSIEESAFTNPWTRAMYLAELDNAGVSFCFLARDDQRRAIGFCSFWRVLDELHINNLAVLPDLRRRGIGSSLLAFVLQKGSDLGARRATLEVRRSNEAAQLLYQRFGFSVAGVREAYYRSPSRTR